MWLSLTWIPIGTLGLSVLLAQALLPKRTALASTDLDFTFPTPTARLLLAVLSMSASLKAAMFHCGRHWRGCDTQSPISMAYDGVEWVAHSPPSSRFSPSPEPLWQLCAPAPPSLQQSLRGLDGLTGQDSSYFKRHFTWGWDVLGLLPININ